MITKEKSRFHSRK